MLGWVNFSANEPLYQLHGSNVVWIKPTIAAGKIYRGGFNETNKALLGNKYTPPAAGQGFLNWNNGTVLIDGGSLNFTLSNGVLVAGAQMTAPGNTNPLSFTTTRRRRCEHTS